MQVVKVFGERNCGTNWVVQLVEQNYGSIRLLRSVAPVHWRRITGGSEIARDAYFWCAERQNLGWKHRCLPYGGWAARDEGFEGRVAKRVDAVLILVKNPLSWLLSMQRRPYHLGDSAQSLVEFGSTPVRMRWRERVQPKTLSPAQVWNAKVESYVAFVKASPVPAVVLRYEDLVDDPEAVLRWALEEQCGILRRTKRFANASGSTKGDKWDYARYRRYYQNSEWLDKLSVEEVEWAKRAIDRDMVRTLGYRLANRAA